MLSYYYGYDIRNKENVGKMTRLKRISIVSMLHYVRLVYRSALFILLLISYIRLRIHSRETVIENLERIPIIIYVTWAVLS